MGTRVGDQSHHHLHPLELVPSGAITPKGFDVLALLALAPK
jgi:hypothetical protein